MTFEQLSMLPRRPFLFLRHGQTDWNLEGRFQGHTDIPLNATGLAQAHGAAERLARQPITAIVSSPLVRASKTAAIVAERLGLPLHIDPELMERSFGRYEGLVVKNVKKELGLRSDERLVIGMLCPRMPSNGPRRWRGPARWSPAG
jgi:probable phosphoglycerate mutase/uncharacterized phosphatase